MTRPAVNYFWLLTTFCDYRCPYCVYGDQEHFLKGADRRSVPQPIAAERWIAAWKRMHDAYGPGTVVLTGGEPTMYPGFDGMLAALTGWHWMELDTSLQLSLERLEAILKGANRERLRFSTSFHPHMTDFAGFARKVRVIMDAGVPCLSRLVAYPPLIAKVPEFRRLFSEMGATLFVNPFNGEYKGRRYPAAYTPEERAVVYQGTYVPSPEKAREFHADIQFVDQMFEARSPKGRLCRSGSEHVRVFVDGRVYRCQPYELKDWEPLGNLLEGGIKLWDGPRPCRSETCEWESRYLVDEADRYRNAAVGGAHA